MNQVASHIRVDAKHRLCLSKALTSLGEINSKGLVFDVYINNKNQIVLDPQVIIPAREAWVFKNPKVLKSIKDGLAEKEDSFWLDATQESLRFWDNKEDSIWDNV